jgi:hypothetical protein
MKPDISTTEARQLLAEANRSMGFTKTAEAYRQAHGSYGPEVDTVAALLRRLAEKESKA